MAIYGTFDPADVALKGPVTVYKDRRVTLMSNRLTHGCGTVGLIDGHIYNAHRLFQETEHPCEPEGAFIHLLEEHSPKDAMEKFDGAYAIAFWDTKRLVLMRDPIGIRPVFYTEKPFTFASERKLLGGKGKATGDIPECKAVQPGEALIIEDGKLLTRRRYDPFKVPEAKMTVTRAATKLVKLLEKAVEKRVDKKVAIAFSGGLDSAILAHIAKQYCEPRLFVAGLAQSYDPYTAIKVAKMLGIPLHRVTIIEKELPKLVELTTEAIESTDYMKTQIGVPFYALFRRMRLKGYSIALAGQGADELFGGYARYQRLLGEGKLEEELEKNFRSMAEDNLERDYMISAANGIDLRLPYLDLEVAKFARSLPVEFKISPTRRKIVLREVARQLGLPKEVVEMPKKAIQYGTGISKVLR